MKIGVLGGIEDSFYTTFGLPPLHNGILAVFCYPLIEFCQATEIRRPRWEKWGSKLSAGGYDGLILDITIVGGGR